MTKAPLISYFPPLWGSKRYATLFPMANILHAAASGVIFDTSIVAPDANEVTGALEVRQYSGVPKSLARRMAVSADSAVSPAASRSIRVRGTRSFLANAKALRSSGVKS